MGHGWTAEPFGLDSSGAWEACENIVITPELKEMLAMLDGERKVRKNSPLFSNVCMSNPKVRSIMANYIADYAERQNNVDFLHIWLADESNGHCECEMCKTKVTADWYIMLLNDIDAELTRRNLDTHLVFIVYLDTFWPPLVEKLNSKTRFTMLYAPITRLYTETYGEKADESKTVPYYRNKIKRPRGMSECLGYLKLWKKIWDGDCFCYEYHFMDFQHFDVSDMHMANLIYKDVTSLKLQGLCGIVEDGSQRSFFPTGFPFYVYGETLFDSSIPFEEHVRDYFSHAYGERWQEVYEYLESLRLEMRYSYFLGIDSIDEEKGNYYCPEMKEHAQHAGEIVRAFRGTINENLIQEQRSSAVAWQLLREHSIIAEKFCEMAEYKCVGDDAKSDKIIAEIIDQMSSREIYYERYYDHHLFSRAMKRYMKDKTIIDNLML
jgi:hypothetical protein